MTSRERVQRFLTGQAADRIPNGLGGCETAGLPESHLDAMLQAYRDCRDNRHTEWVGTQWEMVRRTVIATGTSI